MKKDWMVKESELDEYGIKALMAVLDKSCIVTGCAGSGKSVLALLKAQRIQKERGDNYKIIVFTKALCQYMNSGREELGLHNQFYYHWLWKNKLNCESSDYIIVDEIQDFTEEEIREFINATNKHFFFFGDSAQSIYAQNKDTMLVDEIGYLLPKGEKPKEFSLFYNYRLPIAIARFVQYIGIGLPEFDETVYKNREETLPYILEYNDFKKQMVAIRDIIKRKDLSDVAILLPKNEMVKNVYDALRSLGMNIEGRYNDRENFHNNKDTLNFSSSNPKVMTYHSAKGLQFETIFLPCVEAFNDEGDSRKALYVAMTRTYKELYIMYSNYLPALLTEIPKELYKTSDTEEIEDI